MRCWRNSGFSMFYRDLFWTAIEFRLSGKDLRQLPTAFLAMLEEIRIPNPA
jgi:hypothetical protein